MPTYLQTVTEALLREDGSEVSYAALRKYVTSQRESMSSESWLRRTLKKAVADGVFEQTATGYRLKKAVAKKTAVVFEDDDDDPVVVVFESSHQTGAGYRFGQKYLSHEEGLKVKDRAMRLLGWPYGRATKVLAAYEQFLAIKADRGDWDATTLSPPPAVDELWHLHVLDTKAYEPWCRRSFG
eukprot:CAMPEP_0118912926 /NCGR_PEP_ID=MMETSP1166-20130328/13963_1 /TAXON_ID=1104430 /ORGANISM="Chrysoreinhardia sp, Strain CCMP3193" /LENGTH=182 /DNA_ID=CAMNT_0006852455 /DNA_START=76 /DNA_END=621 /DNA_ORIENTATION=+